MNWHEFFTYNETTGDLIWKERPREHFAHRQAHSRWNTLFAGKVAGGRHFIRKGKASAVIVGVGGKLMKAHNIIWEMKRGPIPFGMVVDHKDVFPFNNAWENLRLASRSQNSFNTKRPANHATGVRGVYVRDGRNKPYTAAIRKDGKLLGLGSFGSLVEAVKARKDAEVVHFGEFARF